MEIRCESVIEWNLMKHGGGIGLGPVCIPLSRSIRYVCGRDTGDYPSETPN